ncbi:MAG: hypothetical protein RSA20_04165, partial [Oscillospiraceae bacterium]
HTGAVKRILFPVLGVALAVAIAALGYRALHPPYTPPPFEPTAVAGVPTPPEHMGYGEISAEGGFAFSIVGTMYQQQDGSLLVYFTNPPYSEANLQCEIKHENGDTLYKSGVLRPGEYVERLQPQTELKNEATKIELNVYAFAPETWYSKGTINLQNILQPY